MKTKGKNKKTKSRRIWKKNGKHILRIYDYYDNIINKGDGTAITDVDNHEILDFSSGQFCTILGHCHKGFTRRLSRQVNRLVHTATHFISPPVMEASDKLSGITPKGLDKVILLSTGTEANEAALRIAKTFTRRSGVAGFDMGYSGISLAMRSIGPKHGPDDYSSLPMVPLSFKIMTPFCSRCPVGSAYPGCRFLCLKRSISKLGKSIDDIAAFILEPILSDGGVIIHPKGYFRELIRILHKHRVLLIADEAQTGFGRTGKWFAIEHHDIVPDIMVIAKGAGNGFPVSGVITNRKIADKVIKRGLWHISSHQSDAIGAAALCAVIDTIKDERLVEKAVRDGKYLLHNLELLKKKYPLIKDIRGFGLMLGMELDTNSNFGKNLGKIAEMRMIEKGLYINYTSHSVPVFRIFPPLTVRRDEIDRAISIMDSVFDELGKGKLSKRELLKYYRHSGQASTAKRLVNSIKSRFEK